MVHCRDWCIFTLTTWFTGSPPFLFSLSVSILLSLPTLLRGDKTNTGEKAQTVLPKISLCNGECTHTHFSSTFGCIVLLPSLQQYIFICLSVFCLTHCFSWPVILCYLIICVSQGCEGRKHLANRARSGQTGRLWLCLHCCPCQLLCGNTLLVRC